MILKRALQAFCCHLSLVSAGALQGSAAETRGIPKQRLSLLALLTLLTLTLAVCSNSIEPQSDYVGSGDGCQLFNQFKVYGMSETRLLEPTLLS